MPSGFKAIERTSSSITVQWNQSSLDGVTYQLQYRVESSDEQWTIQQLQNGATQYTLSNLKPNTSYTVMINSVRNMISSSSATITAHTRIPGIISKIQNNLCDECNSPVKKTYMCTTIDYNYMHVPN